MSQPIKRIKGGSLMKRMKRISFLLLTVVLIMGLMAMSVSAFVPPGHARRAENTGMMQDQARFLSEKMNGWASWIDWEDADWDEEDLIGLPPGIAKKGIPLPPGLMKRRDNLPSGILERFMNTEAYQQRWTPTGDYEPVITRITVEGPRVLVIPNTDEYVVEYEAKVRDQRNRIMDEAVEWSIGNDNILDISINTTTGSVTVGDELAAGTVEIVATAKNKSSISGTLEVELVESDAVFVYNEAELRSAIGDDEHDLIYLGSSITLEKPLEINREVTIEGMSRTIKADEGFNGWLIQLGNEAVAKFSNTLLDGQLADQDPVDLDDLDSFVGLLKISKDADLNVNDLRMQKADIGLELWVDQNDYNNDNKLNRLANDTMAPFQFNDVGIKVVIYNLEDSLLFP